MNPSVRYSGESTDLPLQTNLHNRHGRGLAETKKKKRSRVPCAQRHVCAKWVYLRNNVCVVPAGLGVQGKKKTHVMGEREKETVKCTMVRYLVHHHLCYWFILKAGFRKVRNIQARARDRIHKELNVFRWRKGQAWECMEGHFLFRKSFLPLCPSSCGGKRNQRSGSFKRLFLGFPYQAGR